ncbi:MAG: glycosyltransferase [Solirubrobacteraceae bacterium]
MSLRWMRPPDALAVARGHAVVCVIGAEESSSGEGSAAQELLARTAPDVALVRAGLSEFSDLAAHTGDADLILLHPGARVPVGWLDRLREPALRDGTVGTVSPLGDALLEGVAGSAAVTETDQTLRAAAERSCPRVPVGAAHCLFVPRRTLELTGGLPSAAATLASATAQISARCERAGLVNVLADDLYVACERSAPGRPEAETVAAGDDDPERSALGRSVRIAQVAIEGLSVTIDARSLGPAVGGTQRYTLDLLLALARYTQLRLRAVVAWDIDPEAAEQLRACGRVEVITYEQAVAGAALSHIVHRPQQVFSTGDLNLLALLGRRVVVTHQDLIAYHNPAYHPTRDAWAGYRRVTRQALAIADRVVFFSAHSRHDAIAEDLVGAQRSQIVGAAVFGPGQGADEPPPPFPDEFILCLGSDYRHKNRPFAIAVVRSLRADHGWGGRLVLAGPHMPHGSSRREEEALLSDVPAREAVLDLGSVSEARRDWLLTHARAVIVPSVVEGFGLVPLEAAEAGVPCLFAPQPPLTEVIDESLATLIAWEPQRSAAAVLALLTDGPPRERHLERLSASARRWSWEEVATAMADCYAQAMRSPYRLATAHVLNVVRHEHRLQEIERRYEALGDRVALASDDGFLSVSEQQGLLRVGARPALARATLWPFAVLGSLRPSRPPSP